MVKKLKKIKIYKTNQQYLMKILKNYPNINSGRKNYKDQYIRILKNLLLAQAYKIILKKETKWIFTEVKFQENNKFLTIKFIT